jgi:hypothetical protein
MLVLILLIIAGIELNPGPIQSLKVLSQNVRGLTSSNNKLRHIINLYKSQVGSKNCIIAMQETHEINARSLSAAWSGKHIINNGTRSSCGVALLLSNEWEIQESITDNDGRLIITHIINTENKANMIVTTVYAPNDHKKAGVFFTCTFEQIKSLLEKSKKRVSKIIHQL